jgi:DNA-directed RNA polymerase subunit L
VLFMPMFTDFNKDLCVRGDGKQLRVPGRLEFTITGQDVSLVSGLRRSIMCDVQTIAFRFDAIDPSKQDVRFAINTGSLHNEFVGERIGLIPMHFTKNDLLGAKPESWRFELDEENTGSRPKDVTTAAFKILPVSSESAATPNPSNVFKPDPLTGDHPVITTLMPGQRIALEAAASFGSGVEHARFTPVAACSCFPMRDEAAVKKERIKKEDKLAFDALDAHRMLDLDEHGNPRAHRFCLETQCGIDPADIVESGYESLASRLRNLADSSEGTEKVVDSPAQTGSPPDIASLKIVGEDHTCGALIQAKLMQETDFAGFYIPHQLERSIVVRMRVPPGGASARGMLRAACESAAVDCENALSAWRSRLV